MQKNLLIPQLQYPLNVSFASNFVFVSSIINASSLSLGICDGSSFPYGFFSSNLIFSYFFFTQKIHSYQAVPK